MKPNSNQLTAYLKTQINIDIVYNTQDSDFVYIQLFSMAVSLARFSSTNYPQPMHATEEHMRGVTEQYPWIL